jgi:hypothetical protein
MPSQIDKPNCLEFRRVAGLDKGVFYLEQVSLGTSSFTPWVYMPPKGAKGLRLGTYLVMGSRVTPLSSLMGSVWKMARLRIFPALIKPMVLCRPDGGGQVDLALQTDQGRRLAAFIRHFFDLDARLDAEHGQTLTPQTAQAGGGNRDLAGVLFGGRY